MNERHQGRSGPIGQSWGLGRFVALVAFTVGTASLGIWQVRRQYEVIEQGYAIDRNLFEYRRMLERQKRLHLLLSAYKDPTALQVFAEEELGMRTPGHEDELFIPDPSAAVRVVAPAHGSTPSSSGAATASEPAPSPSGGSEQEGGSR
jgi:hypothetical protein